MAPAFYCFLFRRLKLGFDLLRGGGGDQADHHADQQRGQEGGQQLIDAEHAAQRTDEAGGFHPGPALHAASCDQW